MKNRQLQSLYIMVFFFFNSVHLKRYFFNNNNRGVSVFSRRRGDGGIYQLNESSGWKTVTAYQDFKDWSCGCRLGRMYSRVCCLERIWEGRYFSLLQLYRRDQWWIFDRNTVPVSFGKITWNWKISKRTFKFPVFL